MKQIIIITGHNHFASGILSSLTMIAGAKDNVFAVDFLSDDNDLSLEGKFNKIISDNKDSEILFICDLMGGTPFKVTSKLAFTNDSYEVVTGINLGGLIDTSMKLDKMSIGELKTSCKDASIKSVIPLEKVITKEESSSEGI
ncbi:MAG TPA: PTS fructose transporter subunit IIA [Candidatus Onthousia faecipullorum]|uniref:PTS fructose transporter subunit IIA n=1 Tax=Candidatus Onthousia faecipullorum TaxID=2840887 RepID=A0A9D1KDC5_9FIRM|nr:PTS fructose transporter subunit IIA [Candidatus Onthousia faecipullorum]